MSASIAISSGSTLTKLTRLFRASRNRSLPNSRKKHARCSRLLKSNVYPIKPRARILTAPRPMNRGNRSPRSLECRSSSMPQKSSESHGQHGCFQPLSFARVSLVFSNLREVVQRFGLIPAKAMRLGGLTLVTSFFLHAGIIHLAGIMYFLLVFGHAVEN